MNTRNNKVVNSIVSKTPNAATESDGRFYDTNEQVIDWLKFETLDEVRTWARWVMNLHGLQDWNLKFREFTGRYGDCDLRKKTIRIAIDGALRRPIAVAMNTILHEIAHAIVDSKYERQFQALRWMGTNTDKTLFNASAHFSIPVEELRQALDRKPHDMEWAMQAVAIGVCEQGEFSPNKAVIRRATALTKKKGTYALPIPNPSFRGERQTL